ncbi:hypothetical protein [Nocardia sp. NBC_01388]|uniref:hypothetical protein n=1 Tax=Nocardia sp. NBC_01388 TaxID=2903596 RepID=UPI00324BFB3C
MGCRGEYSRRRLLPALHPALTGANITRTARQQVTGGWRITAATNTTGDYRLEITCG